MKNFTKTAALLAKGVIAILLVVGGTASVFAATLNNDPQDYATLRVKNNTLYPNSITGWGSSVSVNAGDQVAFAIYYHNTAGDTATNLRVRLTPQSTGQGTTQSFTAYVWADNAPQVSGSATVSITSSQTVTFESGTVIWRPNQTTFGSQTLPNGQSGSEVFNSNGLLLGNIAPGWSTQGSVILHFRVSSGSVNPPPSQNLPSVTTYSPMSQASTWAVLNGYVNPNGTSDTTRRFEWGTQSYSLNSYTTWIGQGSAAGNFSDTISGLAQNTTYYYRAVAQNSAGTVYGGVQSFVTTGDSYNPPSGNQSPFVSTSNATNISGSYATLNCYVNPNNTSGTTRWFEWGSTQSLGNRTITLSHGSSASNVQETITGLFSNTTYYFRCVAQNSAGTSYGSILSFSAGFGATGAGTAITNLATSVTDNSARLNGLGTNLGNNYSDGWFEWGLSQSLGNTTSQIQLGAVSSNTFYATLASLSPNTTYYFRAAVRNAQGTGYGDILNFRTNSAYAAPPVTPTIPAVSKDASVTKRVANLTNANGTDMDVSAKNGDALRYTIEIRNTGTVTIKDVSIKDRIPYYVEFANTQDRARLDGTQREVVWFLGDFLSGEVRTVTLDVVVTPEAPRGTLIENTARLEGTNFTRNGNTAVIRVADSVSPNAAAAAFLSGGFLPSTFAGWLLLTILILILVVVARKAYGVFGNWKRSEGRVS